MDPTTTRESKDRDPRTVEFGESSRCPEWWLRRTFNVDRRAAGERQELDVNDYYATIIHEERMATFLQEADASRRAAEARGGRITRQMTLVGLAALVAIMAALALSVPSA
jgi:hypothetical protein